MRILNLAVATIVMVVGIFADPPRALAQADPARLDELFEQLQAPGTRNWQRIERQIWSEWSKSGSPAMALLLQRGQEAMEAGHLAAPSEHSTALTDHAPDFAEGWNARATAYFQADLYGPSMADISRALALNPRHFGALSGLARILEEVGDHDAALEAYRAAHAIHPHQPGIQAGMERMLAETEGQAL